MNKRDMAIIKDLERFRVMGRDDIVAIHFGKLKNPVTSANMVLKRLARDGQIEVSKSFSPFTYFPAGSTMKRNSTKIPHFLSLVDIYKQVTNYYTPRTFQIEPKYSKGLAEPDIYTEFNGTSFFIELQRNVYSQKVMDQKIERYAGLRYSNDFKLKQFPLVLMVTSTRYQIKNKDVRVFQVESIHEFIRNVRKSSKTTTKPAQPVIKYKLG
ncbi:hypothetical protein [Terribacillus saccharophilus]|uniref:hypothetical protein n=1 Tax=Terribacillus saccharophilus TaxID=361277 RepID=UPI002DCCFFD3|nr:hypothetical protein [Terribacillus saccharophilus]MEC0288900.1 hypothetical protein [Terribacillus saccharophilus]